MPARLDAVLLDLDGTLVDSLPALRAAYDDFLAAHDRTGSDEEFARWNGPPLAEVVAGLAATHGIAGDAGALLAGYERLVEARYAAKAAIAAGARELLDWLDGRGVVAAVVTSAPIALARALLVAHGVAHRFRTIVGGDEVARGKPAGDGYREALRRLGVAADRAIAVEDSVTGVTAASDAGLRCVGLGARGHHARLRAAGAITCAESFADVHAIAAALVDGSGRPVAARALAVVCEGEAAPLDAAREREVLRRWEEARRARPTLTDGVVLSVRDWRAAGGAITVATETIPYRRFIAQRAGMRLGVRPLGVSGVTSVGGSIVLGRRASFVTQYPGCWELVPSGGVPAARVRADGTVDVEGQLLEELDEELGAGSAVTSVAALGLVEDLTDGGFDLCYHVAIEATAEAIRRGIGARGEYDAVELCAPSAAVARARTDGMVPTVPAIVALLDGRAPAVRRE